PTRPPIYLPGRGLSTIPTTRIRRMSPVSDRFAPLVDYPQAAMSTLRRPFLDAYRHAESSPHSPQPAEASFDLAMSAMAIGGAGGNWTASEQGSTSTPAPADPGQHQPPRAGRPGPKRPLSSFLHNFDQPAEQPAVSSPRQSAKWPSTALELLPVAAPAYDKLIARFNRGTAQGSLIGIFGCGPTVGTTTTAICLALRCATHGASTLLVDADLANPALAERLGVSVGASWTRSLKEGVPLERTIVSGGEVAVD